MTPTPILQVTSGKELPDRTLTWRDSNANVIDFSTGYIFTLTLDTPTPIVKTTGITGASVAPNITIAFAAGDLDALPVTPGVYSGRLAARRAADNKDREPFRLRVLVLAP